MPDGYHHNDKVIVMDFIYDSVRSDPNPPSRTSHQLQP